MSQPPLAFNVKQCSCCARYLHTSQYAKHTSTKDKLQKMCKECQVYYRKHQRKPDAVAVQQIADPNKAGPRTFRHHGVYTPDEKTVYRNDGNKHILSRGL